MRKINYKIIAAVLLFTSGILFFSLAVQKYQILTSSKATLNLPQCEIPEGSSTPTNAPCASCTVSNDTTIDAEGNVAVKFSCQISCNNSGNPLDTTGCSDNLLPYSISETSWYWCKKAGDHACTAQNELTGDLITSAEKNGFKNGGPWILSRQGATDLNAGFQVPGYQGCGRIQIDVETNQKYSYVINSQKDCDSTVTAKDISFNDPPTPTFGFGFPDQPLTNTPMVPQPTIPTSTPSPTRTPTPTNTPTATPTRSLTPSISPSTTPSRTITPSTSVTPSITGSITPSTSLSPSLSPSPTNTPTPTATPTNTPTPTFTPSPTAISNISVDGQSPGGTSWIMMLVPAGIVALGLLL